MTGISAADRRLAAWLCAFAILVPTWLPLIHHPATLFLPDGGGAAAATASRAEAVVICTAGGLALRILPASGKAPVRPLPSCPICQALHALAWFEPPVAAALGPQRFAFRRLHPPRSRPRRVARLSRGAAPRAPPMRG
jgi:hypothetical protein